MHVGIDCTSLLYARGVSRYTSNIMRALAVLPDTQVSAYGTSFRRRKELQRLCLETSPEFKSIVIRPWPIAVQAKLWNLGKEGVTQHLPTLQVFHSWDWLQPPPLRIPTVTTIHDLAMLRFPNTAHPKILTAHQQAWAAIKQQHMHVIAISHATKRDIVSYLQIDPTKVHVVYEALPSEVVKSTTDLDEDGCQMVLQQLNIHKPFFLFVGTDEPRKNLSTVVETWQQFAQDFQLVVAGAPGWSQHNRSQWKHQPTFVGRVSDQVLSALYAEANVFLYPSLYEGFGLPILESFHHGTPVVTSNNSGMKEVAGNAAELIEPESVNQMEKAIVTILGESPEQQRQRDQRMIIRLQMFDWTSCAMQTKQVYEQALAEYNS